jgi:trimeric autotransporter adhesin
VAIGDPNRASGTGAVAVGANNSATGAGALAIGNLNMATGNGAVALAIGPGASATGANAAAFGAGASAAFAGSTAIGAGARTTAANQIVLGSSGTTVVLPGITSAASLAAQSGPESFVTTDAAGHLAASSFNLQGLSNLSNSVSALNANVANLNGSVASLQNAVERAYEGTAIAIALGGGVLPDNKKFAISANWGAYNGTNAFGATGYFRVTDNIVVNGGLGAGLTKGDVGGRVGVTLTW